MFSEEWRYGLKAETGKPNKKTTMPNIHEPKITLTNCKLALF